MAMKKDKGGNVEENTTLSKLLKKDNGAKEKVSELTIENVEKFNKVEDKATKPATKLSLINAVTAATGIDFAARRQARQARLQELEKEDEYHSSDLEMKKKKMAPRNYRTFA